MVPKLVAEDIPLLISLLSDVFPGVQYHRGEMTALREELKKVCQEMYLTYGDGEEVGGMWVEKVHCDSCKSYNVELTKVHVALSIFRDTEIKYNCSPNRQST